MAQHLVLRLSQTRHNVIILTSIFDRVALKTPGRVFNLRHIAAVASSRE